MAPNARSDKNSSNIDPVGQTLHVYAARGIFREFGETRRGSKTEYKFRWLTQVPLLLVHDAKGHTLTFRNLLPGIPPRSEMDRELKDFLAGRASKSVPEHRRIDPKRAIIKTTNRGGTISLTIQYKPRSAEYAARKAVNLVNEIFSGFLSGPYYDYMVENFGISEE